MVRRIYLTHHSEEHLPDFWIAEVPSLPAWGNFTSGFSATEAYEMALDLIASVENVLRSGGELIPPEDCAPSEMFLSINLARQGDYIPSSERPMTVRLIPSEAQS